MIENNEKTNDFSQFVLVDGPCSLINVIGLATKVLIRGSKYESLNLIESMGKILPNCKPKRTGCAAKYIKIGNQFKLYLRSLWA